MGLNAYKSPIGFPRLIGLSYALPLAEIWILKVDGPSNRLAIERISFESNLAMRCFSSLLIGK